MFPLRRGVKTEMYVWYGTNKYNFEARRPCILRAHEVLYMRRRDRTEPGGYSVRGAEYRCANCTAREMGSLSRRTTASSRRQARGKPGGKGTRPLRARRG